MSPTETIDRLYGRICDIEASRRAWVIASTEIDIQLHDAWRSVRALEATVNELQTAIRQMAADLDVAGERR